MPERDAALEAVLDRLLGDVAGGGVARVARVVGEVGVHVDRRVEAAGELEDRVDVAPSCRSHVRSLYGQPPTTLAPMRSASSISSIVPGALTMPSCGKATTSRSSRSRYSSRSGQRGLDAEQPLDRVDVGMRADRDRAVGDRHVEDRARALEHVVAVLLGLELAGEADRLLERAVARRLAAVDQRLVEVEVGLDEAGQHGAPAGVDGAPGVGVDAGLDGGDALALDRRCRRAGGRPRRGRS